MTEVVKNENIVCTVINITQRNLNILYRYFNIYGSKCYKKLQEYEGDRHIWEESDEQVYEKTSSRDFPFVCKFDVTLRDNDINNFVLTCNLYLNNIRIHTFKILNNSEELAKYKKLLEPKFDVRGYIDSRKEAKTTANFDVMNYIDDRIAEAEVGDSD